MEDKLTPLEAEVLEYSAEPGEEALLPADSYGTAAPPRPKRSYVGLWIALGLIVIGICTIGVMASVRSVRFQRNPDGGWTLTMGPAGKTIQEDEPVRNLPAFTREQTTEATEAAVEGSVVRLQLDQSKAEVLTADEIYAAVSPSVVCLEMTTATGTLTYTGVVLSEDGFILSVTEDLGSAVKIDVRFSDGTVLPAAPIGEEQCSGLCLIKVEAKGLIPASFASAKQLPVGSQIYCIANPYGALLPNVLSDGLLSAKQTVEVEETEFHLLQTSAKLQNSGYGCPILDSSGRVVGMTTAIGRCLSLEEDPCFALTGTDLQQIVAALGEESQKQSLWLGLGVEEIPERLRFFKYPGSLWITYVSELSGFSNVLFPYDVITAINGAPVNTTAEFNAAVAACQAGETVRLTIFRNGVFYYADLKVLNR